MTTNSNIVTDQESRSTTCSWLATLTSPAGLIARIAREAPSDGHAIPTADIEMGIRSMAQGTAAAAAGGERVRRRSCLDKNGWWYQLVRQSSECIHCSTSLQTLHFQSVGSARCACLGYRIANRLIFHILHLVLIPLARRSWESLRP